MACARNGARRTGIVSVVVCLAAIVLIGQVSMNFMVGLDQSRTRSSAIRRSGSLQQATALNTDVSHLVAKEVRLQPGKMGIMVDPLNGEVGAVEPNSQCAAAGMIPGVKVLRVNGEPFSKDKIVAAASGATPYTLAFTAFAEG